MLRRWEEYSDELMNEETVKKEVGKISKDEVRKALKRMKSE